MIDMHADTWISDAFLACTRSSNFGLASGIGNLMGDVFAPLLF